MTKNRINSDSSDQRFNSRIIVSQRLDPVKHMCFAMFADPEEQQHHREGHHLAGPLEAGAGAPPPGG
jgi:hypothetical protein